MPPGNENLSTESPEPGRASPDQDQETQTSSGTQTQAETPDSTLLTGKKAMITALVAIVMNPISMGTGYVLNHMLQKPRFSIEYISRTFFAESDPLPPEVVTEIASSKVLSLLLRDHLARAASQQADKSNSPCTDWLDGASFDTGCYDQVHTIAAGLLSVAETEREALKENLRRIEQKTIESEGIEPMQMVRPEILSLGADRMAPALRGQLAQFEGLIPKLRAFVTAIAKAQEKSTRTGDMNLIVGVLNSGDSDGVIKSRANLNFGPGKSLWLYTDPNGYVIIKAHSFQEITFGVGGSNEGDNVLKEWQDTVRKEKRLPFEIVLKSGSQSIHGRDELEEASSTP